MEEIPEGGKEEYSSGKGGRMMFSRKFILKGNVKVALHHRSSDSLSLRIITKGGRALDPELKEGTTSLMASLLLHGCKGKPYEKVVEELEGTGTSLYFSPALESIQVSFWALREFAMKGLEILRDCMEAPDFPEEELERERQRAIAELRRIWDEPEEAASRIFSGRVFGPHPYSRLDTEKSLKNILREDLRERFLNSFRSASTYMALAGREEDMEQALQILLPVFREGETELSLPQPSAASMRIYFYLKEDAEQVQIRMGHPSFPRSYPHYEEAMVLNYILGGGGFSSRLMERIRAKEGLTYSIRSSFSPMLRAGLFYISTFTRPENTKKTIEGIIEEVKKVISGGVSQEEVEKARSYFVGHFPLGLETPSQVTSLLASMLFYGLGEDYPEKFIARIKALTPKEVNRVAGELLHPEEFQIAVVGNEMALRELESLGEVERVVPEY